jgi:predicted RNase H-like nuclease (RuvC/YqgF family)
MAEKKITYMGIDINPGSSPSSVYKPKYSIIIIDANRRVLYKNEETTLPRIIRLAWEHNVSAIGIDNVYELAPTEHGIARILSLLPPETKLIQVTYDNGRFIPIKSVAEKHGIVVPPGKLSPGKTAYIAALLVEKGIGGQVRLREEKTRITISKSRGGSKGGWSQARYQRRLNSIISQVAQKIKETLDKAGFDYDESYRRSRGGLESAIFTVYAGREKIYGLIKPYDGRDYRVRITPLYGQKLVIGDRDITLSQRPVIVGVDPGIYTGLAVLDISGNLLYLHSSKNLDRSKIASILSDIGKPVVIATDVNPPPDTVKKLSAMFDTQLYVPPTSLSTAEKRTLADQVYPEYNDTHQRDALAAAYRAYRELSEKFKQIELYVSKRRLNLDVDKIKESLVRGKTIAEAIEEEIERKIGSELTPLARKESLSNGQRKVQEESCNIALAEYRERVDYLLYNRKKLEDEIRKLNEELEYLRRTQKNAIKELKKEVEQEIQVERYRTRISNLEKRLSDLELMLAELREEKTSLLRGIIGFTRKSKIVGYFLERLTIDSIKNLERTIGGIIPEGSIILVGGSDPYDSKAVEILLSRGIEGLVVTSEPSFTSLVESKGLPVVTVDGRDVLRTEFIVFLNYSVLSRIKKRRLELGSTGLDQEKLELLMKAYKKGLIEK